MTGAMEVSVIVPTFRRPRALRTTLRALSRLDFSSESYEVLVVDDGPDDSTRKVVEELAGSSGAEFRYIPQPNSGVATARNHGARFARGDLLIFLDDDMIVEPGHIQQHLDTQAAYGPCLVNGHWEFAPAVRSELEQTSFGRFRLEVEEWVKQGIPKRPLGDGCVVPSGVTACNLGIGSKVFRDLGGFDEGFPHAGSEDQEFSARAADAGVLFVYNERIRLFHNDHRLTLRQFAERQEQGALTAVYLASKRPAEFADRPLIVENRPIARADSRRVVAKKVLKRVFSTPPLLEATLFMVPLLERLRPARRLLGKAYWGVSGLYIYRGVRKGLRAVARAADRHPLATG